MGSKGSKKSDSKASRKGNESTEESQTDVVGNSVNPLHGHDHVNPLHKSQDKGLSKSNGRARVVSGGPGRRVDEPVSSGLSAAAQAQLQNKAEARKKKELRHSSLSSSQAANGPVPVTPGGSVPSEQRRIDQAWKDMAPPKRYHSVSDQSTTAGGVLPHTSRHSSWVVDRRTSHSWVDDPYLMEQAQAQGIEIPPDATQDELDEIFLQIQAPNRTLSDISGLDDSTPVQSRQASRHNSVHRPMTPVAPVPEEAYVTSQGVYEKGRERTESQSTVQINYGAAHKAPERQNSNLSTEDSSEHDHPGHSRAAAHNTPATIPERRYSAPSTGLIDDEAAIAAATDPEQIARITRLLEEQVRLARLQESKEESDGSVESAPLNAPTQTHLQVPNARHKDDGSENPSISMASAPGPQRRPSLIDKKKTIGTDIMRRSKAMHKSENNSSSPSRESTPQRKRKVGGKRAKSAGRLGATLSIDTGARGKRSQVRKKVGVGIVPTKSRVSRSTGKMKQSSSSPDLDRSKIPRFLKEAAGLSAAKSPVNSKSSKKKSAPMPNEMDEWPSAMGGKKVVKKSSSASKLNKGKSSGMGKGKSTSKKDKKT